MNARRYIISGELKRSFQLSPRKNEPVSLKYMPGSEHSVDIHFHLTQIIMFALFLASAGIPGLIV